jgi:hypothetical protein
MGSIIEIAKIIVDAADYMHKGLGLLTNCGSELIRDGI